MNPGVGRQENMMIAQALETQPLARLRVCHPTRHEIVNNRSGVGGIVRSVLNQKPRKPWHVRDRVSVSVLSAINEDQGIPVSQ